MLSAQGTKLNRRGLENRQTILDTAVRCLATGDPEAMSANRIAKEAGVTWGTIQHQFGDTDGVWAAVVEHVTTGMAAYGRHARSRRRTLHGRVTDVVEWMWRALDSRPARAVHTIRTGLSGDAAALGRAWPKTAAALGEADRAWTALVAELLDGLVPSAAKLRRVRQLLPAAMHGIRLQANIGAVGDAAAMRHTLTDALTSYLET